MIFARQFGHSMASVEIEKEVNLKDFHPVGPLFFPLCGSNEFTRDFFHVGEEKACEVHKVRESERICQVFLYWNIISSNSFSSIGVITPTSQPL